MNFGGETNTVAPKKNTHSADYKCTLLPLTAFYPAPCPTPTMAYRRSYRPRTTRKRTTRRAYGGRRGRPQRSTVKRRYTKRMTAKRVLNISSRKKRDTMQALTNVTNTAADAGSTFYQAAATLKGGRTYIFPWIATARDLTSAVDDPNTVTQRAARTSSTCYMRGLKERIQIQTSTGMAWQWRRVCFTFKGNALFAGSIGDPTRQIVQETSAGFARVVTDWGNSTPVVSGLLDHMFRGRQSIDWRSYFTAPLDPQRVTVKYDKTRIISSGNANGVMRNYTNWFPMNHNLLYDDEEVGTEESPSNLSVKGTAGMGDYYIVDIISGGTGSTTSDLLSFDPESTLYWHEK
nr:capsid protein [Tick-associated circular DNA virus]